MLVLLEYTEDKLIRIPVFFAILTSVLLYFIHSNKVNNILEYVLHLVLMKQSDSSEKAGKLPQCIEMTRSKVKCSWNKLLCIFNHK